jgi:uncharacterized phiE125 gp8 family phage protein
MGLTLITPPTTEPLSTGETKHFLRVDTTNDDALIDGLIVASRQYAEAKQKRQLISATWKLQGDQFPSGGTITLPLPPVSSVTSVEYVDTNGASQTFSADAYTVDTASEPARIVLNPNYSYPSLQQVANAVSITFVCGYASPSSVPAATRQAMLLYCGHLYENRLGVVTGTIATALPLSIDALLSADSFGFYG